MPLPAILALLVSGGEGPTPPSPAPRFELASPLPTVPGVMIDRLTTGYGLAQETARAHGLQGRTMWIDATANLDRYNTEAKIVALVKQIADVGFNTIVFDVKPISGQVVYNSRLAPKLTAWRGRTMDPAFDPLPIMVREAHRDGLTLLVSLNAFSEGHRMFKVGPGYDRPDEQTVLYEARPVLKVGTAQTELVGGVDKLPSGGGVGVVTSLAPLGPHGGAYVVVRKDGIVLAEGVVADPTASSGAPVPTPNPSPSPVASLQRAGAGTRGDEEGSRRMPPNLIVPKGGALVAGTGDGAAWLRANAHLGDRLRFDTEPVFVPIRERPEQQYPLMMNPFHPAVQRYALDIVREVVANYAVDGVLYDDRLRFGGMNADFSELTRARFEARVGRKVAWPDDVFKWTLGPTMVRGMQPGPLYGAWMAFRAEAVQDFVRQVRTTVKAARPACLFGVYAGSWYGDYPANGHNYASPDAAAGGFWFADAAYQKAGTAPLLDLLVAGCYYPTATILQAFAAGGSIGATVEASATLVDRLVRGQAWVYAGIALSDFKDDPEGLQNALQAALASVQGVMVFDLSHDVEPMWPVFARAFAQRREPPTAHMALLAEVKKRRAALDRMGAKEPPIVIATGTAGTGQ